MKKLKIIVVGGTAAGPAAAAKAARINPSADILLLEKSDTVSYGVCEIPFAVSGEISDEQKLIIFTPEQLAQEKRIRVKTHHALEKIIPSKRKILVRDLNESKIREFEYDRLILATGATPKKLNISGEDGRNVFYIRTHADTQGILNYLKNENPKEALVIGAGFVGVEIAQALREKNLNVTLIHNDELPLNAFDFEIREAVVNLLRSNQINFVGNTKTEAFIKSKSEKVEHVITNKGTFQCDMVIVAIGIVPNTGYASSARLRLNTIGAIKVNNFQETNIDGIYAAGDCCEVKNIVSNKPSYTPLATIAARTGWVAGENAAGRRAKFSGALFSVALKIFNLEIARTGLSELEARNLKYNYVTEYISSTSRIPFLPGSKNINVKLIVDKVTKRILGASLIGEEGAALRANTLAVAIQMKLTVDELSGLDFLYFPKFSPLWDPILIAANTINRKLK